MTENPWIVTADTPLSEAMALMEELSIRHLPVAGPEDQLLGVVSDRELMKATGWLEPRVTGELVPEERTVADVLHPMPLTIGPEASLREVAERLVHWGIGCTPVVDEGRVVGMITEMDVLREFIGARREGLIPSDQDPTLSHCMTREPTTVDPTTHFATLADLFDTRDHTHLPVTDGPRLLGIVSDRDVRMMAGRGLAEDTPVAEILTAELFTLPPAAPLSHAAELMLEHRFSAVPVEQDGLLLGLVTSTDIVAHCARIA